jgi:hypothetical protein
LLPQSSQVYSKIGISLKPDERFRYIKLNRSFGRRGWMITGRNQTGAPGE